MLRCGCCWLFNQGFNLYIGRKTSLYLIVKHILGCLLSLVYVYSRWSTRLILRFLLILLAYFFPLISTSIFSCGRGILRINLCVKLYFALYQRLVRFLCCLLAHVSIFVSGFFILNTQLLLVTIGDKTDAFISR